MRRWRVCVAAFVGLCVTVGCTDERHVAKPSALLITVDTLRPDRLSCYGYAAHQTPAIDGLAAQGVLFEQAVCDIPWTTGSMASVMTGTYGSQHGVHLSTERLPESRLTLAEVLRAHGYETAAVIGSFPVASIYGLDQGFESYDEQFTTPMMAPVGESGPARHRVPIPKQLPDFAGVAKWADEKIRHDAFRPDVEVTAAAVRWLRMHRDSSFFLWVHYFGPHERLVSNVAVSSQEPRIIADYDRDLEATDAAVGKLLSEIHTLGLDDDLLVVLHADHGQSLGEHAYVGHGEDLHDVSVRVPLLIRLPGRIAAGTRVRELVRNVDIMPTILDLRGFDVPPGIDGRSIVPYIRGQALAAADAYSETYAPTIFVWPIAVPSLGTVLAPMERHAIRTSRWKFVESNLSAPCTRGVSAHRSTQLGNIDMWELEAPVALAPEECSSLRVDELYDLNADPAETRNVAVAHADVVEGLRQEMRSVTRRQAQSESITLSPAQREKLRALGYAH